MDGADIPCAPIMMLYMVTGYGLRRCSTGKGHRSAFTTFIIGTSVLVLICIRHGLVPSSATAAGRPDTAAVYCANVSVCPHKACSATQMIYTNRIRFTWKC